MRRVAGERADVEGSATAVIATVGVSVLLAPLLAADAMFIVLHAVQRRGRSLQAAAFSIEEDGSWAELLQYAKELVIIVLLGILARRRHSPAYLGWMALFLYLLLDDALLIHERAGFALAEALGVPRVFALRGRDFGELAVTAVAGLVLALVVALAHRGSTRAERSFARSLVLLLAGLLFFGVVVDMMQIALWADRSTRNWTWLAGTIEDGSEMVMMSVLVAYVYGAVVAERAPIAARLTAS